MPALVAKPVITSAFSSSLACWVIVPMTSLMKDLGMVAGGCRRIPLGEFLNSQIYSTRVDIFRVVAVDVGRVGLLCRSRLGDGQYYDEVFYIIL